MPKKNGRWGKTMHGHAGHGVGKGLGKPKAPEYVVWNKMLQRCLNPKDTGYKWYGARGIAVCKRWLKFENFLADMGPRPPGYSIERKKNDQGYKKSNCKWIPRGLQAANTRKNTFYTAFGKTLHLAEWARESGINKRTLQHRLKRAGESMEQALAGGMRHKRMLTAFGRTQHIAAWSRETGLSVNGILNRIQRTGMTAELALTAPLSNRGRRKGNK